jgi:phospholipid transport system substrate-binding protein
MISRRLVLAAVALAIAAPLRFAAAESATPAQAISSFYDTLLSVMKNGSALGFKGRSEQLGPAIHRAFDLPRMTRLMVGLQWSGLTPEQQQQLIAAFGDFSVAIYASRFDDYSGEHFEVDPNPTPTTGGVIVHSKLVQSDGEPVEIDYLMRETEEGWQIVDVYLSGTVSELATRRSEFSDVMRRGGAEGLVDLLQKRAAELRG